MVGLGKHTRTKSHFLHVVCHVVYHLVGYVRKFLLSGLESVFSWGLIFVVCPENVIIVAYYICGYTIRMYSFRGVDFP